MNGFSKSTSYGQTSTASSVASALVSAFNADSTSPVNASVSGATVTLTAKTGGAATNYSLSASSATNQGGFTGTSFPVSTSGSSLTGGADGSLTPTTPYSVALTFTPNGSIATANDNVNGNWNYRYDEFNRLTCSNLASNGTCAAPTNGTPSYTYDYDRFGNRWHQNGSGTMILSFSGANNRMDGYSYDAAGNLLNDGAGHSFTYDAENRLIAVGNNLSYVYDGNGRRIRKTVSGVSTDYLYDVGDQVLAEMSSSGGWNRGEVFAKGRHVATYNNNTTYFTHADWLGTERVRTALNGSTYESCTSLPFGDWLTCSGGDPSPLHFTGKERDSESGFDNFGARYNSSNMGRFISVDPAGLLAVNFQNPQTLNLYVYTMNNPLRYTDPTGMYVCADSAKCDTQQDKDFEAARQRDLQSKNADEHRAAAAYGDPGVANGVSVSFVDKLPGNEAGDVKVGLQGNADGSFTATADVRILKGQGGDQLQQTLGHEGSHIFDGQTFANNLNSLPHDSPLRLIFSQGVSNIPVLIEELTRDGKMPSLDQVVAAIDETRREYQARILAARRKKSNA